MPHGFTISGCPIGSPSSATACRRTRLPSSNTAAIRCSPAASQGVAQVIVNNVKDEVLEGGSDRRASDGAAVGVPKKMARCLQPSARRSSARLQPSEKRGD